MADAAKRLWRSFVAALGGNRIDAKTLSALSPDEAMRRLAEGMARGQTLGRAPKGGGLSMDAEMTPEPTAAERAEAQRQYNEVVARYTNADGTRKPGWMKAPNGKPTKLTERQWVQVRTENFKRWFGDWESTDKTSQIMATQPYAFARPSEGELAEFIEGYRNGDREVQKRIVDWAASIVDPVVENRYIGAIRNSKGSIRDTLNHARGGKFRGPLKVLVHQHLNEILKDAVLFDERDDGNQHFYNLAHRITFDGQPYFATISVLEDRNGNRTWTVEFLNETKIARTATIAQGATSETDAAVPSSSLSVNRLLKNLLSVKPENVSKVVDENGEPRVVYHGSNKRFYEFSKGKIGTGASRKNEDKKNLYGPGFYLAEDYNSAREYGRNVIEAFANIRNPAHSDWNKNPENDGIQASIGFIGRIWVADNPSQIKSATDNAGTFSGFPDIRFSSADVNRVVEGTNVPVEQAVGEIRADLEASLASASEEFGEDISLVGLRLHGSRVRGDARADSDLDVVMEYSGDVREDDLFNFLNGDENRMTYRGLSVDVNPIRAEETGTLGEYMKRDAEYDAAKRGKGDGDENLFDTAPAATVTAAIMDGAAGKFDTFREYVQDHLVHLKRIEDRLGIDLKDRVTHAEDTRYGKNEPSFATLISYDFEDLSRKTSYDFEDLIKQTSYDFEDLQLITETKLVIIVVERKDFATPCT